MEPIDYIVAKNKLSGYVDNAKSEDDLILICKKFLEKYKPDVFKPSIDPYAVDSYAIDRAFMNSLFNSKKSDVKILEVGVSVPDYGGYNRFHEDLCYQLASEIMRTNLYEMKHHKDPMTYQTIYQARIGVCKP
jgi:hypothetical protein